MTDETEVRVEVVSGSRGTRFIGFRLGVLVERKAVVMRAVAHVCTRAKLAYEQFRLVAL